MTEEEPKPLPPVGRPALGVGLADGGGIDKTTSVAGDDAPWPGPSAEDEAPRPRPAAWGLYRLRRGARRGFKLGAYPALVGGAVVGGSALGVGLFGGFGDGRSAAIASCLAAYVPLVFGCVLFAPVGALLDWSVMGTIAAAWRLLTRRTPRPVPSRRGLWHRTLKRAVLAFALLFSLSFATSALLTWWVEGRWRALVAESDASDPTWRLDRLLADREAVSDEENGAPVVTEAYGKISEDPERKRSRALGGVLTRLARCPADVRIDDDMAAELAVALEPYREVVEVARRATDYPSGRTDVVVGPTVFDTRLPHLDRAGVVAKILRCDSALRIHRGDLDGALDSCRAMLGVARSIGDEPWAVAQLERGSIVGEAVAAGARVLGQGEAGEDALRRFQEDLDAESCHDGALISVRGEWAMLLEYLERVADGRLRPARFRPVGDALQTFRMTPRPWARLWAHGQAIAVLERRNAMLAAYDPSPRAFAASLYQVSLEPWIPFAPERIVRVLMPVPFRMGNNPVECSMRLLWRRAEAGALAVLVAVERHRMATGEWPETLEDLDPYEYDLLPLDPADEEMYALVRTEGGVRVYSYGFNADDDGGEAAPDLWTNGGADDIAVEGWDVGRRGRKLEADSP